MDATALCSPWTRLSLNITCAVMAYLDPSATINFYHLGSPMEEAYRIDTDNMNSNGTKDTSVTVTVSASSEPYQCVVTGRGVDRSAYIWVLPLIEGTTDLPAGTEPEQIVLLSSKSGRNRGKEASLSK